MPHLYKELLILLIILLVYSGIRIYQFNTWERGVGEVVELKDEQIRTFTGNVDKKVPVIRYVANDHLYEIRATLLTGFNDLWAGDQVKLIYPPSDPAKGRVFNFLGFWLPIPSFIIMVMVFLVSIGVLRITSE